MHTPVDLRPPTGHSWLRGFYIAVAAVLLGIGGIAACLYPAVGAARIAALRPRTGET